LETDPTTQHSVGRAQLTPTDVQRSRFDVWAAFRAFAVAAMLASAVELLFQRGLSRMGTSLTIGGASQQVLDIFNAVNRISGYSLNMAIVLCWVAIALAAWGSSTTLAASGDLRWLRLLTTIGLVALLVYTPALFLTSHQGDVTYQVVAYLTLLLILAVGIARAADWRGRVVLTLMALAYAADAYYVLANTVFPGVALHSFDVYNIGQFLVMVNGLLIFVVYALAQRPSRLAIILSGLAMITLTALFLAPMKVDVPAYIVTFSSGYQFALPWPFYVMVLGAVVYTITQALAGAAKGWAGSTPFGLGLLLIAIAGYDLKLDLQFYQAALGLLLLVES
jgi:hypothetical protein